MYSPLLALWKHSGYESFLRILFIFPSPDVLIVVLNWWWYVNYFVRLFFIVSRVLRCQIVQLKRPCMRALSLWHFFLFYVHVAVYVSMSICVYVCVCSSAVGALGRTGLGHKGLLWSAGLWYAALALQFCADFIQMLRKVISLKSQSINASTEHNVTVNCIV